MKNNTVRCLIAIVAIFAAIFAAITCFVGWWANCATNWAILVRLVERFVNCVAKKLTSVKYSLECLIETAPAETDPTETETTQKLCTNFTESTSHNGSEALDTLNWLAQLLIDEAQPHDSLESNKDDSTFLDVDPIFGGRICEPFMLAAPAPLSANAPAQSSPLGDADFTAIPALTLAQLLIDELQPHDSLESNKDGSLEPFMLAASPAPLGAIAPAKEDLPLGEASPRPADRTAAELDKMTKNQLFDVIRDEIMPWASSLAIPKAKTNKDFLKKFIKGFYKSQKTSLG